MPNQLSVLTIVIIAIISYEALASSAHHVRRPRNEFILRKCMASAEFNRRNIGNKVQNPVLKKTDNDNASPETEKVTTEIPAEHQTSASLLRGSNLYTLSTGGEVLSSGMETQPNTQKSRVNHVKNTPLTTVNIKTVRNMLPAFRRKSFLPELGDIASDPPADGSQNIIVIKPTT